MRSLFVTACFSHENDLVDQIKRIKNQLGEHVVQLSQMYDAMENLLDEKSMEKNGLQTKNWIQAMNA